MPLLKKILFAFLITCLPLAIFAADIRDPTRPPDVYLHQLKAAMEKKNVFVVHAILTSNTRRLAVINGTIVQVGDIIANATVVKISSDCVSLKTLGSITKYPIFIQSTVSAARK